MIDFGFIAERYNYWIFIVLMMIGLYIVISRGNLIKKIVGLNIFQTSVFIYYISIGKIAGGTAPILLGDGAHGQADDGEPAGETAHAGAAPVEGERAPAPESAHAAPDAAADGLAANDLAGAVAAGEPGPPSGHEALHAAPSANPPLAAPEAAPPAPAFEIAPGAGAAHQAGAPFESLHQSAEIIYTNPLPHVLILTAIVVGVATTAVGLALAVRIREAYGTIEEDELEAADEIAEFGRPIAGEAGAR